MQRPCHRSLTRVLRPMLRWLHVIQERRKKNSALVSHHIPKAEKVLHAAAEKRFGKLASPG